MIYLGPAGIPTNASSLEDGITALSKMKLNAMEVEFVRGVKLNQERAKAAGKLAEKHGIRLSCHAPYFVNLNAKDPEKIKPSQIRINQTLDAADALGAKVIVVHAGFYMGKTSDEATAAVITNIRPCVDHVENDGLSVKLGIETMGKHGSFGTQTEINKVCEEYKNTVVQVIDFAHIHARYAGSLKTEEEFEKVLAEFEKTKPAFLHSHFTGVNYGEKGELNHLTIDSKQPDFALLAPALKKRNYDITVISESPILEKDSLVMRKILNL